jgi:hypothetical protein
VSLDPSGIQRRQARHWVFAALLSGLLEPSGRIYILGLAGILSGLYLDWKMALFGLFLIFSGVVIAFLDNNALLIAVGGTATIAVIMTAFVWIRHQQRRESQAGSAP